ncbi:MAG: hypothetical protein HXS44_00875 [Theionarchaea archaeon]|nr:hypothetical protein [Theionarchaea archaeon]
MKFKITAGKQCCLCGNKEGLELGEILVGEKRWTYRLLQCRDTYGGTTLK